MHGFLISTTSHNTILSRIAPMTSDSYRSILTKVAKRLGLSA